MSKDEYIDGVKIEKLPMIGRPLSLKGTRYRPVAVKKSEAQKIKKIAKALEGKNASRESSHVQGRGTTSNRRTEKETEGELPSGDIDRDYE
jgi:hypothetical protein